MGSIAHTRGEGPTLPAMWRERFDKFSKLPHMMGEPSRGFAILSSPTTYGQLWLGCYGVFQVPVHVSEVCIVRCTVYRVYHAVLSLLVMAFFELNLREKKGRAVTVEIVRLSNDGSWPILSHDTTFGVMIIVVVEKIKVHFFSYHRRWCTLKYDNYGRCLQHGHAILWEDVAVPVARLRRRTRCIFLACRLCSVPYIQVIRNCRWGLDVVKLKEFSNLLQQ